MISLRSILKPFLIHKKVQEVEIGSTVLDVEELASPPEPEKPTLDVPMAIQLRLICQGQPFHNGVTDHSRTIALTATRMLYIPLTPGELDSLEVQLGEGTLDYVYFYWALMLNNIPQQKMIQL